MIFWSFGFLRMGTVGLVAQALGRGDYREVVMISLRNSMFMMSGIPTNPSSLLSGTTLITLLVFDVIVTASEPFFFKEST